MDKPTGVLLVHNSYQQPGGEDRVFELEARLLEAHGHEVYRYQDHNRRIFNIGAVQLALSTLWNRNSHREVTALLDRHDIGVVHVHNTFPLISPSVYYAAKRKGAAVVQTLHNYRLLCPDAKLMRDGRCCEECLGRVIPWASIRHSCYQGDRRATAVTAMMTAGHRFAGTWTKAVDRYIALTQFSRHKFIQGGLPGEKIAVKPNFIDPDPGCGDGGGDYALFAGRLSPEKGIATLIAAWEKLAGRLTLHIAGDGPLAGAVQEAASRNPSIRWLGALTPEQVKRQMQGAKFLVCPSVWYESFGLIIVEAFATGLPVIGSDLGAMAELIHHEQTGLLFPSGDDTALAESVESLLARPRLLDHMRTQARREYEQHYTALRNYEILRAIYEEAKGDRRKSPAQGHPQYEHKHDQYDSSFISKRVG